MEGSDGSEGSYGSACGWQWHLWAAAQAPTDGLHLEFVPPWRLVRNPSALRWSQQMPSNWSRHNIVKGTIKVAAACPGMCKIGQPFRSLWTAAAGQTSTVPGQSCVDCRSWTGLTHNRQTTATSHLKLAVLNQVAHGQEIIRPRSCHRCHWVLCPSQSTRLKTVQSWTRRPCLVRSHVTLLPQCQGRQLLMDSDGLGHRSVLQGFGTEMFP